MRTLPLLAAMAAIAAPAAADDAATGASLIEFCVEALAAGDATQPVQVAGAVSDTIDVVAGGDVATPGSSGAGALVTVSTASYATPLDPVFMVYNWGETDGALGFCEVGFQSNGLANSAVAGYRNARSRTPDDETWASASRWTAEFDLAGIDIDGDVDLTSAGQTIVRLEAEDD